MPTNLGGPTTRRRAMASMALLTGALQAAFPVAAGGTTFYVNSASSQAAASNAGTDPRRPLTTIALAIAKCTSGADDVIICGPGHTETLETAAAITINKSSVTIVGQGSGNSRPFLFWATSTAAQMIVSSNGVRFKNFVFDFTGIDAIVAAISVTGADAGFEDCEFYTNGATTGCVLGILTAATASRLQVLRCVFWGPAVNSGTTTTAQIKHEVGADYLIRDCYFTGKMTQAILNATTVLRGRIQSNVFVIATGTVAITMAAASTPMISNNRINVPSGTAPIVAAAGFMAGNIYSAAAGVTAGTASTF